eukprot:67149_1
MPSSLHNLSITTLIYIHIYTTLSQTTTSPTTPTPSSTTSTETNNENTHLYIIIGILSTIIVFLLCAAACYFYYKHQKDKTNEILFGVKNIVDNINSHAETTTAPKKPYESPPVTPTPKKTTNNNTNDNIDNNKSTIQNRQIQVTFEQTNTDYPQTSTIPTKPAEKTANNATKNLVKFLNTTVSQRNLNTNPVPIPEVTNPQSVQQSIYLQEQRLAFSKMRIASSPNLNKSQNTNTNINSTAQQKVTPMQAPPKMNRAMFASQQNLTHQPAMQSVQERRMRAAQFQSMRTLPTQNNYQQQQAQFTQMKMTSSPNFGVQNVQQNMAPAHGNYQQQQWQGNYYDRQRAMTTPQNYQNGYPQNVPPQQMNMINQVGYGQNQDDDDDDDDSVSIRTESEDIEMGKVGNDLNNN